MLLVFQEIALGGQLHFFYQPLPDKYALLVKVIAYDGSKNILKARISKIWGEEPKKYTFDKSIDFELWAPIEWGDVGKSPISFKYRYSTTKRQFKRGSQWILIPGDGYEVFKYHRSDNRKMGILFDERLRDLYEKLAEIEELTQDLLDFDLRAFSYSLLAKKKSNLNSVILNAQERIRKADKVDPFSFHLDHLDKSGKRDFFKWLFSQQSLTKEEAVKIRAIDLIYELEDLPGRRKLLRLAVDVLNTKNSKELEKLGFLLHYPIAEILAKKKSLAPLFVEAWAKYIPKRPSHEEMDEEFKEFLRILKKKDKKKLMKSIFPCAIEFPNPSYFF